MRQAPWLLLVLASLLPSCLSAAEISGDWSLHTRRFGEDAESARLVLKTEGAHVTGHLNELVLQGTLTGDHLKLTAKREADGKEWGDFEGEVKGDDWSGIAHRGSDQMEFSAHRLPRDSAPPRAHVFTPTRFERLFSGEIAPVLHIHSGDTVKTTTVDAGGVDAADKHRSMGGNPETGPFYVEGALPGDTLAITIRKLTLNRDTAMSGDRIVPTRVSADYYRDAKFADDYDSTWKLDRQSGTATLAKPSAGLKNFKVQLQPMLGCVGVAPPARQAFRAGWLGSWGGNMDFHGIKEGTTVYLPVYREGALLFVGDGHALEGDGELNGDALETSMDVEFEVKLLQGQHLRAPRFEDADYLMASGMGGSLDEALQNATTELARWLEHDYKLTPNESNIVLGASIHYEIAEVVDPQAHIVAKIRKSNLASLRQ